MSEFILHHFDASPFSEKIRLIFGYKRLAWHSVQVPRILPKPELMPLTGGYRKTPVLQIGRDIYCDTHLIARTIERLAPEPPLINTNTAAGARAFEHLADTQLFLAAIPLLFSRAGREALREQVGDDYLARFSADRDRLFSGGSVARPDAAFSHALWEPAMADLDAQLAASPFLLGEAPTLADFAVYHPIWYIRANAGVAHTLDAYPCLLAWFARMQAFGHGAPAESTPATALAIASRCDRWQPLSGTFDGSLGFAVGDQVVVRARDYGVDPVAGRLVHLDSQSIVLVRPMDNEAPVRVHFPRLRFVLASSL